MKRLHLEPIGWHVFARGTRRLELFRDDEDYLQFLAILDYAVSASQCTLWAFALMSNHYHLVIYGSSEQLTSCMRRLNSFYSRYHNLRYGLSGHTFDGPYQAYPQPSLLLLLRVVAYVFLNPVVAGLAPGPEDYRWSCFRCYTGQPGSPLEIDPSSLLGHVQDNPKIAWEQFYTALDRESRRPKPIVTCRLNMTDVHAQQFEWILEHARELASRFPDEDPVVVAMYWARRRGVSPRAMASVLGPAYSISKIRNGLYRFQKRLAQDPALVHLLGLP